VEKLPYLALSAAASFIAYRVQHQAGAVLSAGLLPMGTRVENAVLSYIEYLGQFFWPTGLAAFYPYPPAIETWLVAGCAVVLVAISVLVLSRPYLAVGWFWYLGTLVPVIGLVQVGMQARADRYTYIPMVGISIMLAWGMAEIMSKWPRARTALQAVSVLVCLGWLAVTWTQVPYWQNSVALFEHAIAATGSNFIAETNLGVVLAEQGRTNDALRHLYTSVEENPEHADGRINLGAVLGQLGRTPEAAEQFAQAIRIQPKDAQAHFNLGNTLLAQGKLAEAEQEFRIALSLSPDLTMAHFGLGSTLINEGKNDEAIVQFTEALRLDPSLGPAREGLNKAMSLKVPGR
jgi:cytochrome c-type biogenesis protein CcmH/NrfG